MAFIKRNLVMVILGLVGLLGIGGAVWGAMAAGSVKEEMSDPISLVRNLTGMKSQKLYNSDWIEQAGKRSQEEERKLGERLKAVELRQATNAFAPAPPTEGFTAPERDQIIKGLLPAETATAPRYRFRPAYKAAHADLLKRLGAMTRPSEDELNRAEEIKARAKPTGDAFSGDPYELARKGATVVTGGDGSDRATAILGSAKADVWLRRAKEGKVYVDPNALAMHHLALTEEEPSLMQIWQAQMSLWIQQDLVLAIARVNERAEQRLAASGFEGRPWVAYVPIKRLLAVTIAGVLGGTEGGGGLNVNALRYLFPSYTALDNSDKFFVVPMAMRLVMEPESLQELMTELANVGFYNVVHLNYDAESADPMQLGFVYGSRPVINVNLAIEGYYLHSIYEKYMPADIKSQLSNSITAMERTAAEGGGGRSNQTGRRVGGRD